MLILPGTISEVSWLAFRPDNLRLAAGLHRDDVAIWDLSTYNQTTHFPTRSARGVFSSQISYSPQGQLVGSRGYSGLLYLNPDGKPMRKPRMFSDDVRYQLQHAVSACGEFLLVSSSNNLGSGLRLFRKPWGNPDRLVWNLGHTPDVWFVRLAFLPHGKQFFAIERRRADSPADWVSLRDAQTGELLDDRKIGSTVTVSLSTTSNNTAIVTHQRKLTAWKPGERTARVVNQPEKRQYGQAAAHPNRPFVAVVSNGKEVRIYDTATWREANRYEWPISKLRSVAFSPDGTLAAAGSRTGQIVVWDFDL